MFASVNKKSLTIPSLPTEYSKLKPTVKRLVREEYARRQQGRCCYCGNRLESDPPEVVLQMEIHPELYPEHFFNYPVHLHHDHITDLTIGTIHSYCNAVMWEYENE